jgi:hypothetical protein
VSRFYKMTGDGLWECSLCQTDRQVRRGLVVTMTRTLQPFKESLCHGESEVELPDFSGCGTPVQDVPVDKAHIE